jgi:hypothetical protein
VLGKHGMLYDELRVHYSSSGREQWQLIHAANSELVLNSHINARYRLKLQGLPEEGEYQTERLLPRGVVDMHECTNSTVENSDQIQHYFAACIWRMIGTCLSRQCLREC